MPSWTNPRGSRLFHQERLAAEARLELPLDALGGIPRRIGSDAHLHVARRVAHHVRGIAQRLEAAQHVVDLGGALSHQDLNREVAASAAAPATGLCVRSEEHTSELQ